MSAKGSRHLSRASIKQGIERNWSVIGAAFTKTVGGSRYLIRRADGGWEEGQAGLEPTRKRAWHGSLTQALDAAEARITENTRG